MINTLTKSTKLVLNNGLKMPLLGLGTYMARSDKAVNAV